VLTGISCRFDKEDVLSHPDVRCIADGHVRLGLTLEEEPKFRFNCCLLSVQRLKR
jgi:hypothetical protein